MKRTSRTRLVLLMLVMFWCGSAGAVLTDGYSLQITVTNFAGRGALTNFPLLVKLDANNTSNYTGSINASGWDLRFWEGTGVTQELKYEIDVFDRSGTSYIWVQVPELTNNTSIHATWGDPAYNFQANYTTNGAVWSDDFEAVWHLGADENDSSPYARHGTNSNSVDHLAGQIGSAQSFAGDGEVTTDYVGITGSGTRTMSAWVNADGSAALRTILAWGSGSNSKRWRWWRNGSGPQQIYVGSGGSAVGTADIRSTGWRYLVARYSGGNVGQVQFYLDGAVDALSLAQSSSVNTSGTSPVQIGNDPENRHWLGQLDEVRIASATRSADWIWAEWMNQGTNHDTFVAYSAPVPPAVMKLFWFEEATSDITITSAVARADISKDLTETVLLWDEVDQGTGSTNDWPQENRAGFGAQSAGSITGRVSGLSADTAYVWRLYGMDGSTDAWSRPQRFASRLTDSQAPRFTNAVGRFYASGSTATLGWEDLSDTKTGFALFRSSDGLTFSSVGTPADDAVSYVDVLPGAGTYTYRLMATNKVNKSGTDPVLCETNVTVLLPAFGVAQALQVTDANASMWPFRVLEPQSVLVVGQYADAGGATKMSFGGVDADGIMTDDRGSLAYFVNPSITTNLNIVADKSGFFGAWVLRGVDLDATPVGSMSDTIMTTEDGMCIVSWAYGNNEDIPTPGSGSVVAFPLDINGRYAGVGSGTGAGGSKVAGAAGSYDVSWDTDGFGSPLAYAFERKVRPAEIMLIIR